MTDKYIITLANAENDFYTAYRGTSHTNAQKAIDALRRTLILSGGTAQIFAAYWGRGITSLWQVTAGVATFDNALEVK